MATPLVIKSAEFVKSAVRPVHYPPDELPEVAFAGRSNVGKSSLINCIVQRKKLVRTSRTPGQTQMLNFFIINGGFHFVDFPGYGFARVPESVRAQWRPMVEAYLTGRKSLRGVVQIMDIRHPPTPDDLTLWQWLQGRHIPAIPVMTKADKIKRSQWNAHLRQAALSLGVSPDQLVLFSSSTNQGRSVLMELLGGWLLESSDGGI
jgi:GTP-binding protein